jgi:hypothetical protein
MDVTEMLTIWRTALGDPNAQRFSDTNGLIFLNQSQNTLANNLPDGKITSLIKQVSNSDFTNDPDVSISYATRVVLSDLDTDFGEFFRIISVIYGSSGSNMSALANYRVIYDDELVSYLNEILVGTNDDPVCWIQDGYLNLSPLKTPWHMYYIRKPKELVKSGASGYRTTICEFNVRYHDVVVDYAVYLAFMAVGQVAEAERLLQNISNRIGVFNVVDTKPTEGLNP